jgi:hypothetical protein
MSIWIPFTVDHVKARLAVRELDVYESTARMEYPEGGGDAEIPSASEERLPQIVAMVLARFRGAIRSNPLVTSMGAEGTLPDFCIFDASVMARNALIGMPPVAEGMTDPRVKEQQAAEKALESLRTMRPTAFADDPVPTTEESLSDTYGGDPALF